MELTSRPFTIRALPAILIRRDHHFSFCILSVPRFLLTSIGGPLVGPEGREASISDDVLDASCWYAVSCQELGTQFNFIIADDTKELSRLMILRDTSRDATARSNTDSAASPPFTPRTFLTPQISLIFPTIYGPPTQATLVIRPS